MKLLNSLLILILHFWVSTLALPPQKPPSACIDPTFACQDLQTAKLCGVVKDCITDIWSTLNAPEDNNEICDLCKQMVQEAKDQLLSNETQEEIKEVFEGSCALIPIKVIADECKKLVDEFIPELIEMLASRMDPNMVCTVAGLCNNGLSKELSAKEIVSIFFNFKDYCNDCKNIFNTVQSICEKIPENEIKDMLFKICNQLPDSDKCEALIKEYLPMIYSYITNMDSATVCEMIGECTQNKNHKKLFNKYQDNMTCEFCEAMVQHLRDLILTNTTKEEFRTALLNLCSLFKSFASECKQLVNDYFDMFYDLLDQVLNPQTLCTYIGLCSSDKVMVAKLTITPMIKMWDGKHPERKELLPLANINFKTPVSKSSSVKITAQTVTHESKHKLESNDIKSSINQLPLERMIHPILSFKQDTDCAFCKAIMFFLNKDINVRNEKAIEDALGNVCEKWIPGYPKECKSFVEEYYKKVVELLLLGVKYEEVCDYLNICKSEKILATKVLLPFEPKNDFRCDICKKVMTYLENELGDKATEEEIREALDKVCTVLPSSVTEQCQDFVDKYTETIIALIIQEVKPSAICNALGLCSESSQTQVKSQFTCELCEDVMTYLKQVLKDPKTEDEIKQALDEVCSILPQSITKQCEDFVNQYTDLIISLLLQEMDPDQVCAALGLCPKKKISFNVKNEDNLECTICTQIMFALENELKDKTVESEIRTALDNVCSLLPNSYAVKCQKFVDKYTETIITLLVQNIKPDMICSVLKICPYENIECIVCQYFLHFLQEQLMENSTEYEIKQLVKEGCSYLPKVVSSECDAFVNEYGDAVIVLLAQKIDPSVVCVLFKICPTAELKKNVKLDTCEICETAVDYIDQLLEDDNVDKEITDLAAKICNLLPESSKQECISIVELYGPYILQMIGNLANSKQVCQSIDLCPRTPGHAHLLGEKKCTFGPDYWCKSPAHAAACKAEDFCKKKVWKN